MAKRSARGYMSPVRQAIKRRERNREPALRPSEADVLAAALQFLAAYGIPAWRNNTGAFVNVRGRLVRFGKEGSSDITGIDPRTGRRIEIECKAPGKKLREGQRQFLDMVNRNGGIGLCVHSSEELEAGLKEAGVQLLW